MERSEGKEGSLKDQGEGEELWAPSINYLVV